jgi:heme/copper-type cytochrome/quinol oxidase subunit 1
LSLSFFSTASMIIAIPSAVSVFAWLATIWTGRPVINTAFLFFAAFVFLFVVGGVSGVMTAAVPVDLQLTDTYFVVAHLHYVLLGINVFPVAGGIVYWFPEMTGKLMNERLGKWSFWVIFTGFNLGFFPMHIAGLLGMPRRVYTDADDLGWNTVNLVTSLGSFLFAAGVLLFAINVAVSRRRGKKAGSNPWDAPTLEWSMPSPPPAYNFVVIPSIASRHPLWEQRLQEGTGTSSLKEGMLLDHGRETIGTSALDAEPDVILRMPGDSLAPFVLTVFTTGIFVGLLLHSRWIAGVSVAGIVVATLMWLWPQGSLLQTERRP